MRIQFHRAASEELAGAASWYEAQQPGLGDDLLHEIDRALLTIDESPQAWPMLRAEAGLRRFLLSRFPHAIIYDCVKNAVRVFAVAHNRRRPGYWRARRFQ